jgi:hypothetical protein
MSNSPLVCYTKISPNKNSPRNHKIDTITIHHMAGNLSIETCGNVFQNTDPKKAASSNYGIGSDGRVGMYVEEKDRSWCSRSGSNDHRAITIEVANCTGAPDWRVSDKAYATLIELVTDICKRNSIEKLIWATSKTDRKNHKNGANMTIHSDFASTSCPGPYLQSKMSDIAAQVNAKLAPAPQPAPTPAPAPSTDGATKFVTNLYVNALNRQPDDTGLQNWANQLTSKKTGGANVAQGIVFSQECINRKLSNDAWVTMLYPAVLGRQADEPGKKNWVNQLNAGVSREQVFYNFVTTPEFANYCKSCGIEVGKIDAPKSAKPTTPLTPTKPAASTKPVTVDKSIRAGDTVRISPTAKYYNGAAIPSWVKQLAWRVNGVSGNRAVLGRSSNGRYNINSPINTIYLTKI